MPNITRHNGPDVVAAEQLATERRHEQEAQALRSHHEHQERRMVALEQERTGTPANAEQDRLRADAKAAYGEHRKAALAAARGEVYEPVAETAATTDVDPGDAEPDEPDAA